MKKETLKTALIGAIAGAIVAGGTSTVIAYTVNSNNVNFRPTDSAWKVNTVADAIEDLYIKKTGNNYSTEERVVGTWIDGKPIYQKTITDVSVTLNWNGSYYAYSDINIPIQDTDAIISSFGLTSNNILYWLNVDKTRTSGKWTLLSFVGASSPPLTTLTFQYTKTTDSIPGQEQAG